MIKKIDNKEEKICMEILEALPEWFEIPESRVSYARRSVNKKSGIAGYFPQGDKFWCYGVCPKANKVKIQCGKCENQSYSKLGITQIMKHLKGQREDALAEPNRSGRGTHFWKSDCPAASGSGIGGR